MNATGVQTAQTLAAELKRRWRRGERPDAAAALAGHPDLARFKSIVLDLAFEEYLLREKDGAAPDAAAFAELFPAFRASVRNMLDAHRLLHEKPELLGPGAVAWPEAGAGFEGLDLVAELGRGAFGRAYLAFDPGTDRLCVLKLAPGAAAEARVIGRLAHPHVTDIYWARPVGPRTAVCMPFVGVSTLADVIAAAFPAGAAPATARVILDAAEVDALAGQADRRSAPVVRPGEPYAVGACAVGARIADAVAYLHREGVVHGDLKPSNVVVGPGGAPHLIDFNLAGGNALPATARGTPAYMAPEVLDTVLPGWSAAAPDGARVDVFALGVVLFELLTGRHPFHPGGKTSFAHLAAAARRGPPVFPRSVPRPVAVVVAACLAPDPAARPVAASVAAALDRHVGRRRTAWRRWWRRAVGVIGLAFLATAVGVVVTDRPRAPGAVAIARSPETAEEFFARGREYLRAGDYTAAQADFTRSYRLSGDPWTMAYVAYALALNGQPTPAADFGRQALRDGAVSPAVRNNLGFALSESSRPLEAITVLDETLKNAPGMQAALYNRAIARYRATSGPAGQPDIACADDIRAALAAGPPTIDLRYSAAIFLAACSNGNPRLRAESLDQLRAAIADGKDPVQCRAEYVFRTVFRNAPEFTDACETSRGPARGKPPVIRLVEPTPPLSPRNP